MQEHPPAGLRHRWPGWHPAESVYRHTLGIGGGCVWFELTKQLQFGIHKPTLTTRLVRLGVVRVVDDTALAPMSINRNKQLIKPPSHSHRGRSPAVPKDAQPLDNIQHLPAIALIVYLYF